LKNILSGKEELGAAEEALSSSKEYTDAELQDFASEVSASLTVLGQEIDSKANATHNHKISEVENLQANLDALENSKADKEHIHTVDSALSTTSTNPVENQAVTNWLADNVKDYRIAFGTGTGYQKYAYLTSEPTNAIAGAPSDSTGLNVIYSLQSFDDEAQFGVLWENIPNIPLAKNGQEGIVLLEDSVSSTSTRTAATPNSVKQAYDLANSKANVTHNHDITEINNLQTELDNKSNSDHTHDNATQANHGLMSNIDKTKLDNIADGATRVVVDSSLIADSTNPVQSNVLQTALAGKEALGAAEQALEEAKAYTDEVVSDLVGTAPDNLNTIHELAQGVEENQDLIDTLDAAITQKADKTHNHDSVYVSQTSLGKASGVATLGTDGKVLTEQLPSNNAGGLSYRITNAVFTVANWVLDSSLNKYKYVYSNANITTATVVNVMFTLTSLSYANAAGVQQEVIEGNGTITLYSNSKPTADLVGDILIYGALNSEEITTDAQTEIATQVTSFGQRLSTIENNIGSTKHYYSLAEVNNTLTINSSMDTVFAAMANNSILHCIINGTNSVYPASVGVLEIVKIDSNYGTAEFHYEGKIATGTFTA